MYDTFMILVLLMFINSAGGFYIYLRFGPRKLIMATASEDKHDEYFESIPPVALLSSFGKKLVLLACTAVGIALLLLSKLLFAL